MKKNACPSRFVNKIAAKETLPREEDKDNKYVILPYIKGLSENLRRMFKNHNVNLHFNSNFTIRNKVINLKDKIKPLKNDNLVYKINCSECPISYVGDTKQGSVPIKDMQTPPPLSFDHYQIIDNRI